MINVEGRQDGSSNHGVLSLGRRNDLDLHGGRGQVDELLLETISNTREHGCSSRKNDVPIQVLADVNVALHDGVVGGFVEASRLPTQEGGLEESLRGSETLVSDGDDLTVRQLVGLLDGGRGGSSVHLSIKNQERRSKASP